MIVMFLIVVVYFGVVEVVCDYVVDVVVVILRGDDLMV